MSGFAENLRVLLVFVAFALSCTPVSALQTVVKKGTKVGAGCVGRVISLAPGLRACGVAGAKTRIWCPNGDIFDDANEKTGAPLARSLCNMTQIP